MRPIASHPLSDPFARTALVIDRDALHSEKLAGALRGQGFTVHVARDGLRGVERASKHRPDLMVVDLDLPGIDGFETIRRIRAFSDGYILVVSDDETESAAVEAFRAGADDYVMKPYGPHALRARIDALLRRSRVRLESSVLDDGAGWMQHGSLRLHAASRRVEVDGAECDLTRSEFDILLTLMSAKDQVFTKASLALMLRESNGLLGHHITPHDRHAVEVHIMNLRRKLADDPRAPLWIETVRGLGYRLAPAAARVPVMLHVAG
ncbi:response regulator transcription factor [Microbacterium sp. ET2]|uniref:response regulator transcription factor n=1 Tax=Microbacterium albipurpureum TaxID=3050384 RepID=UPI00259C7810|nr:response regulator transcription factor [Microbacterium sp. ET2 (Ac-2212)]WJL94326.1 response regulator transcription factor [Microbacterium sp. ET2 (Ac-2212)]